MLIVYKGKQFSARSIYELSLEQLIALEDETTRLGKPLNLGIMAGMFDEVEKVKHKDPETQGRMRGQHPLAQWTFAINVFCAMRIEGAIKTFAEVLPILPAEVTFLREPGDPDEGMGIPLADPTVRPKRTPRASAPAARKRARSTQAAKSQASKSRKASTTG